MGKKNGNATVSYSDVPDRKSKKTENGTPKRKKSKSEKAERSAKKKRKSKSHRLPVELYLLVCEFLEHEGIAAAQNVRTELTTRVGKKFKSKVRPGVPSLQKLYEEWLEDYAADTKDMSDLSDITDDDEIVNATKPEKVLDKDIQRCMEKAEGITEEPMGENLHDRSVEATASTTSDTSDSESKVSKPTETPKPVCFEKVTTPTNIPLSTNDSNSRKRPADEEASGQRRVKTPNTPFQRVPESTKVDPRFASNAYQSYEYADRAHQDLVVTKGKGFIKEKNKKKRGSYRGGQINIEGGGGVRFTD